MPEPDPARRFLIRRRIVLGAVALLVVLAVSGFVFGVFDREPVVHVRAKLLGFGKSADGTSTVALIVLTSLSTDIQYRSLIDSNGFMPDWLPQGSHFQSYSPSGLPHWDPYRFKTGFGLVFRPAPPVLTNEFELPADGRRGRIVVPFSVKQAPATGWLQGMGRAFGLQSGTVYIGQSVECDEEIQCPLVRPDGTVEPARLAPKGEHNGR